MHQPSRQGSQSGLAHQRESSSRPSSGTISVIIASPGWIAACLFRVMSIVRPYTEDSVPESKRERMEIRPTLSFFNEDKVKTYQPHEEALVVTLQIGGYDVRRVLTD